MDDIVRDVKMLSHPDLEFFHSVVQVEEYMLK